MKTLNKVSALAISALALTFGFFGSNAAQAATSPNLGTANGFAILAGTPDITNVPTSSITGNVGLSPATGAGIGLTAAQVTGTIFAVDNAGPASSVNNPGLLTNAKNDLTSAYDALSAGSNATCTTTYAGTKDLVGLSLVPGVYCADAFQLSGTLTLSGSGVWIFRSAATLVTSGTANIVGGSACDVWWKVASSATLGTNTSLIGNILALTSITLDTGASLNGRALARNGAVTLQQNTINAGTCTSSSAGASADQDIRVTKTASKTDLKSGPEKVTFTYRVSNTGDTDLTDVSLDDNKCDNVDRFSGDNNNNDILDTNEAWNYRCTKTVKETETNVATAKGHANGKEVKATDRVTVTVSTPGLPNAGVNATETNTNFFSTLVEQVISFFSLAK